MLNGLQVVLQTEAASEYRCEGFAGLAIAQPAQIIIHGISPAHLALVQQISQDLRSALLRIHPQIRSQPVPCRGACPSPEVCHAFKDPRCIKVFVVVGDRVTPVGPGDPIVDAIGKARPHKVLVILPRRAPTSLLGPLSHYQAQFFQGSPTEAVPAILAAAELASEERRLFISYRRREARGLAEQLFDALGREGYRVFLDSFSIPPGVDFHAQLHQELADKTLLLVLESRHLSKSEWVEHEVSFARAHRMGLLALHLPLGSTRPEIDDTLRFRAKLGMFWGVGRDKTLRRAPLAEVMGWISTQHERFVARRRYQLRQSMQKALLLRGIHSTLDPSGLLQAARHGADYRIWLTPHIPEPQDFHHTSKALQSSEKGVVIGPGATWNLRHAELLDWVERMSHIRCFDEGRIRDVADNISRGWL